MVTLDSAIYISPFVCFGRIRALVQSLSTIAKTGYRTKGYEIESISLETKHLVCNGEINFAARRIISLFLLSEKIK